VRWKIDKAHRLLKKYGIKGKKRIRKGKLSGVTLDVLGREFKIKSKAQVAKELGVSRVALYRYLKKSKVLLNDKFM